MVILLHREDAYEKDSPRMGEADIIVAKHRNGPTATVVTAFQGTTHASWICTGVAGEMAVRFRKGRSRVRALRVWGPRVRTSWSCRFVVFRGGDGGC